MTVVKGTGTLEYSPERFDIKVRTKSFMMNSQELEGVEGKKERIKEEERPQTQHNYLGSRRRKGYFSKAV
jgi:hypothetical protein